MKKHKRLIIIVAAAMYSVLLVIGSITTVDYIRLQKRLNIARAGSMFYRDVDIKTALSSETDEAGITWYYFFNGSYIGYEKESPERYGVVYVWDSFLQEYRLYVYNVLSEISLWTFPGGTPEANHIKLRTSDECRKLGELLKDKRFDELEDRLVRISKRSDGTYYID